VDNLAVLPAKIHLAHSLADPGAFRVEAGQPSPPPVAGYPQATGKANSRNSGPAHAGRNM
jgi:hypothetical protein